MPVLLTSDEWAAVGLSLRVALVAWLLCLPAGIGLAWALARWRFRGKTLLDAVVHLPLVLPPVAVGYVLLLVVGSSGLLGRWLTRWGIPIAFTWRAAVIASAVMALPLMVRSVRVALELVDPGLEAAARTLGASPLRVLTTITLPLAWPGLLSGSVLCFVRSLGEFGATMTVAGNIAGQTRTLPVALYSYSQSPSGDGPAVRLMIVSIALSMGALLISELLASRVRGRAGA